MTLSPGELIAAIVCICVFWIFVSALCFLEGRARGQIATRKEMAGRIRVRAGIEPTPSGKFYVRIGVHRPGSETFRADWARPIPHYFPTREAAVKRVLDYWPDAVIEHEDREYARRRESADAALIATMGD